MESQIHENKAFEKVTYAGKGTWSKEFEQCTFKSCDFSESSFSQCRFTDCQFIGCNLAMLKLNRSTLSNVGFKECKLIGVNFSECEDFLFTVRFENCILDYASFMKKKMPKTQFLNSSLKNVTFAHANLTKAMFDNTDLEGTVFERTELKEANFATAYNYTLDPEQNNIKKARFSQYGIAGLLTKYDIRIE